MTTIINQSTSVLVTLEDDNFIVENLSSREKVTVPSSQLISTVYKYFDGFEKKFKAVFPEKQEVILTKRALRKIEELIYFNRVDS